jgi:8-oxo-dGTP pyrophosphatase MutT (NUDIX family)
MIIQKIARLKKRLNESLPGYEAHVNMSPSYRPLIAESKTNSIAGVMLLLYPMDGELHTVFMKRNEYKGAHSGQISFPGGKFDSSDIIFLDTALRETHEEFGIPEADIEVLGKLTPLLIPVSNFLVYPFVGFINNRPHFKIDPLEVSYLIEVELNRLLHPDTKKTEFQIHGNYQGQVPFFEIDHHKIWGATAMILNEFLEIWSKLDE